jgi:hypothetical protein
MSITPHSITFNYLLPLFSLYANIPLQGPFIWAFVDSIVCYSEIIFHMSQSTCLIQASHHLILIYTNSSGIRVWCRDKMPKPYNVLRRLITVEMIYIVRIEFRLLSPRMIYDRLMPSKVITPHKVSVSSLDHKRNHHQILG